MQVGASAPRMLQGRMFSKELWCSWAHHGKAPGVESLESCALCTYVFAAGPNKIDYSRRIIGVAEISTAGPTILGPDNLSDYDKLRRVRIRNTRTKTTSSKNRV